MGEHIDPRLIEHWTNRLAECLGGADVARAALRNLGVIHPIREVEEINNVFELRPEGDEAA